MKSKILVLLLSLVMILQTVPAVFASDTELHKDEPTSQEMIDKMLEKGVVTNMADGDFHASDDMTKEDFLKMTAVLFRMEGDAEEELYSKNIIGDSMLATEASSPVTHEAAAVILYNAFVYAYEFEPNGKCDMMDFSSVSGCAQKAANAMWYMGFTKNESGNFYPSAHLTREEAATIAYRMFYTEQAYTMKNGPGDYENDELATEVNNAYARGARKVVFTPGKYYMHGPSAYVNNRWSHFTLDGMKDFTLEGYNVKLFGCDPVITGSEKKCLLVMLFANCEDITIRGFTSDFSFPIFTQATVTAVYENSNHEYYIDFEIDEGYPSDLTDTTYFYSGNVVTYLYDGKTRKTKPNTPTMNLSPKKIEGSERSYHGRNWSPHNQHCAEVGDKLTIRMQGAEAMNTRFSSCRNVTLEDYTICGGNFGLLMEPSMQRVNNEKDHTHLKNVRVTYGEKPEGATEERLVSTYADAFHLSYLSGDLLLEDCLAEGNLDDNYAFHGRHYIVSQMEGDIVDSNGNQLDPNYTPLEKNQLIISTEYFNAVLEPGDRMACYDVYSNYLGMVTLKKVTQISGTYTDTPYVMPEDANTIGFIDLLNSVLVEVDDASILKRLDYMMDVDASSGNVVMRNCTGRDNIGRGVLSQQWNILVENCTFQNNKGTGISIEGEKNCAQGPYSRDVVIKDCKIINCGHASNNGTGHKDPAGGFKSEIAEEGRANANLVLDGNYFEGNYGYDINVGNTCNVVIKNNVFGKKDDGSEHVKVCNSEDVLFENSNKDLYDDSTMLIYQDVDNFKTETEAHYSSELKVTSENNTDSEWSYEYAKIGTDNYEFYNYQYWTSGSWVKVVPLWSQDKEKNAVYGYFLGEKEVVPGSDYDIVETYTAPFDGRVRIKLVDGLSVKEGYYLTDGVKFKIVKNRNESVWPQAGWKNIVYKDPIDFIEDIEVEVKKGDKLRFRVNCNKNVTHDIFYLSPEVEYVRKDGEASEEEDGWLAINERYVYMNVGDTFKAEIGDADGNIEWSTSRTEVADVDQNGNIVAKYPGVSVVTAKCGEKSAICIVAVHPKTDSGIVFTKKSMLVQSGATEALPIETADGIDISNIKFKSLDSSKVKVNDDGTVTVLAKESASVKVVAEYGDYKTEILICTCGE